MAESGENTLVLVTGAANYVAGHVIRLLKSEGYRVRGVVDSLDNEEEVKALHELSPDNGIDIIAGDLLKTEDWEAAVKDAAFVIHSVSPFQLAPSSMSEEDVVKKAVEGTQNVLKACVAAKTVKRVILTSSLSAIAVTVPDDHKQLSEADWASTEKVDAWTKSKTMAEQAAWDYIKELPDDDKIELAVVNAASVVGPVHKNDETTTSEIVKRLMERSLPFVPKINLAVVDVKDLASAHLKAMTVPEAAGNRHIVFGHVIWLKEVAQLLAKEFKPQGFNVPTMTCPYVALWVTSIFDKKNKVLLPQVGKMITYDNTRMKDVLGLSVRDIKESLVDMANSMVEHGLVIKKVKKPRAPKEKAAAVEGGAGDEVKEGEEKPTENGEVKDEDKKEGEETKEGKEEKTEKIEDVAEKEEKKDKEEKCDEEEKKEEVVEKNADEMAEKKE